VQNCRCRGGGSTSDLVDFVEERGVEVAETQHLLGGSGSPAIDSFACAMPLPGCTRWIEVNGGIRGLRGDFPHLTCGSIFGEVFTVYCCRENQCRGSNSLRDPPNIGLGNDF
jgi:hypothetical protein